MDVHGVSRFPIHCFEYPGRLRRPCAAKDSRSGRPWASERLDTRPMPDAGRAYRSKCPSVATLEHLDHDRVDRRRGFASRDAMEVPLAEAPPDHRVRCGSSRS